MTKIDKDTYIEFLKKLEEADIPENIKFMLRNSWYGDTMPYSDLLELK